MPGSELSEGDRAVLVDLGAGRSVYVLSLESIAMRRVEEFVATGHEDVARQAILLVEEPDLDEQALRARALATGHARALVRFTQATRPPGTLDSAALHELARELVGLLDPPGFEATINP